MPSLESIRTFYIDYQILLVGAVLLFLCYRNYHDPKEFRSATTFVKYLSGYVVYAIVAVFAFLFIAVFPDLVSETISNLDVTQFVEPFIPVLNIWKEDLPTVVSLALLAVLITKVRPARRAHEELLAQVHALAHIPREIRKLSGQLYRSSYQIVVPREVNGEVTIANAKHKRSVEDTLRDMDIDKRDWRFSEQNNLRYDLAKAVSLNLRYKEMLADPSFSYYATIFSDRESVVSDRFVKLCETARLLVKKIRSYIDQRVSRQADSSPHREQSIIGGEFKRDINELRRDIRGFQRFVCEEIARAALLCKRTEIGRGRSIRNLGFVYAPPRGDVISQCCLAFLALLVLVLVILPLLFSGPGAVGPSLFIKIFFAQLLAISLAIVAKTRTHAVGGIANSVIVRQLGLPGYLGVALIAATGGLIIALVIEAVRLRDVGGALAAFHPASLAMPGMMAGVMAFQLDRDPAKRTRWKESAIQSGAMTLASFAVFFIWLPLMSRGPVNAGSPIPDAAIDNPQMACLAEAALSWLPTTVGCVTGRQVTALVFALIFGATLGALVPAAYFKRRADFLAADSQQLKPGEVRVP